MATGQEIYLLADHATRSGPGHLMTTQVVGQGPGVRDICNPEVRMEVASLYRPHIDITVHLLGQPSSSIFFNSIGKQAVMTPRNICPNEAYSPCQTAGAGYQCGVINW